MLPRVASALIRGLDAVASSIEHRTHGGDDPWKFQLPKKDKKQPDQQPKDSPQRRPTLKLVSSEKPPEPKAKTIDESQTFLLLINSLQDKRGAKSQKQGSDAYLSAIQTQKKSGRFRKGTIVDLESA